MGILRTANPTVEPVTLNEAKLHLRVDGTDEDALITALIVAAREQAEHRCGRAFVHGTWRLTLDAFPDAIRLPIVRAASVTSVQYVDEAGATQTLASAGYQLDNANDYANWLVPASGYAWPSTLDQPNSVIVTYVAGYGADAAAVPASIKQWVLLSLGAMYAHREGGTEKAISELPRVVWDGLLDPYRVLGV